jgi:DNA-binding CsgD family transcriptional regulator
MPSSPGAPAPLLPEPLTARECEVLEVLGRGYSNRQIADELVIGVRTAETHVERILRKLNVGHRAQAMVWVREHGRGAGGSPRPGVPNNLPLELTSFVGREAEGSELRQLIRTSRLVTLTGAGGVGKTRLALQVSADSLEGYADGAWFVDLAVIVQPELVPQAVAGALGVHEEPGQPVLDTRRARLG